MTLANGWVWLREILDNVGRFLLLLLVLGGVSVGSVIAFGWWALIDVTLVLVLLTLAEGAYRTWDHADRRLAEIEQPKGHDPAAARRATADALGELLISGQAIGHRLNNETEPFPKDETDKWHTDTEAALSALGVSYVARFRSDAAPMFAMYYFPNQDERNKYRVWIHHRLAQLTAIIGELSRP